MSPRLSLQMGFSLNIDQILPTGGLVSFMSVNGSLLPAKEGLTGAFIGSALIGIFELGAHPSTNQEARWLRGGHYLCLSLNQIRSMFA